MAVDPAALLNKLRADVRHALSGRSFVRLDRGNALFVSNAPLFQIDLPVIEGFDIVRVENLLYISPTAGRIEALESACNTTEGYLAGTLMRFAGQSIDENVRDLFSLCLKLTTLSDYARADRLLRQNAALALRGAIPGGGLTLCAELLTKLDKKLNP